MFRGRSDVYPRRFDNLRSGKSGYAPACGNEWVRGVCEKPRIRCSDCPSQHWLPLTDEVVHWHLAGEDSAGKPFLMGLYPMLLDETCFFLAADFDGPEWRDDVLAFLTTCREHDIPAALERSRSGDGAHLWIFFENATPAALARKLGTHLLTETLDKRPGIGLASYDRFFPNQDTLPRGGFGNLIALPLQKRPREQGHSVFLNDALEPHPDQWAFLASIKKVPLARVDTIVQDATRLHRVLPVRVAPDEEFRLAPWQATPSRRAMPRAIPGPLPPSLELTLGNLIYIPKEELPPALRNRLLHLAAFQNPEFYRAQAMRLSTHDKPRIIACAEDYPAHFGLPRGCLEDILELLQDLKIPVTTREERQHGTPLNLTFQGTLRPDQEAASKAMLAHDTGVLAATTAF
ncbi:MAG: TOTE conflict system archaeo-eukaryotic primase domain-containing protein, partial [Terrimicrobiaceae bacterium]